MKQFFNASLFIGIALAGLTSCSDNHAAKHTTNKNAINTEKKESRKDAGTIKPDGPSIGQIETDQFVLKLHRAFSYEPKGDAIISGTKPKPGYKFIYLDVSLRNKSAQKLEGGFLFIALRVTDEKGTEYKKPAAALASYTSEHPEDNNDAEYAALWETFKQDEFHREIVYAVEVPQNENAFILHMPTDRFRKEWKTIRFSL